MLLIPGAAALSGFRLSKLLENLQTSVPRVRAITAYHYYVCANVVTGAPFERLQALVAAHAPQPVKGRVLWLSPRLGTISPWSSKATDIALHCDLGSVGRIERVLQVAVETDGAALTDAEVAVLEPVLIDPMTETLWHESAQLAQLFVHAPPRPLAVVPLQTEPQAALQAANERMGLALSADEVAYLAQAYATLGRDPTDVELMMFAQANSEHCRHKIFNASWTIDGEPQAMSLFAMIKNTHAKQPEGTLSAYRDNAAVMVGSVAERLAIDPTTHVYQTSLESLDILMKVETHNHPTAISPFAGAATGSGGEIRDEGATGMGARPKAGLTGFTTSNLRIPGFTHPWEGPECKSARMASPLQIMTEGPLGAAAFNNEFGRPGILGYFRTFEQRLATDPVGTRRGFHKPIMLAGGLGNIRRTQVEKAEIPAGALLVVLGGPAMLIGLGGGAASSVGSGQSQESLDFASVQRGNPEMQRRAQEVIEACTNLSPNPILLIHDVGAGGLSNAVPEAIAHSNRGGVIDLRAIPSAESGLSPLEIWCNEAQERYVLCVRPADWPRLQALCARERCPVACIGTLTDDGQLKVHDARDNSWPVNLPLSVLLGKPPKLTRHAIRRQRVEPPVATHAIVLAEAIDRLLLLPTIADKSFLITIGDRSVTGLIARDSLVGPWQVAVSDYALTCASFTGYHGEAMAIGERPPVALLSGPASGRLAVAEAITNLMGADIAELADIKLSANWMGACHDPMEEAVLYDTVNAIGMELAPSLGLAIPVGKDSLSMRSRWQQGSDTLDVVSPVSVVISAFAKVNDVRAALTPVMARDVTSTLYLIDLGLGQQRLGGSCLAQVYAQIGDRPADLDDAAALAKLFAFMRAAKQQQLVSACHDRSDGGLIVTLLEMAFASRVGLAIRVPAEQDLIAALCAEEPGLVVQVPTSQQAAFLQLIEAHDLAALTHAIATPQPHDEITIHHGEAVVYTRSVTELLKRWSQTSYEMRQRRDNPACAQQEYEDLRFDDPGLSAQLSFAPSEDIAAPLINTGVKPRVAILREQGVNSQYEMAAAFRHAGFTAIDVHMSDILSGQRTLADVQVLAVCGGFSYGDVLGAGEGWAKSIRFASQARDTLGEFFARADSLTLGVCNGCQMLAALHELIPGSAHWPKFRRNTSEQFEGRVALVKVMDSVSPLLAGMHGSVLPIAIAHGEGRAEFLSPSDIHLVNEQRMVPFVYVDHDANPTERYPLNPNGSPQGIAGIISRDGRVTLVMPHPERVRRSVQNSFRPTEWQEDGGWMRLFRNARVALG
jgi:phosphoribosylformylglycinamidine synthase